MAFGSKNGGMKTLSFTFQNLKKPKFTSKPEKLKKLKNFITK